MKIKSVKIQNFRSIKNETLVFPENGLISVIWPNNAWKSNFLRAIDLVLWDWYANEWKLEEYDFYCWKRENEIYIQVNFSENEDNIEYFCFKKEWGEYKPKMKFLRNDTEYYLSNEKKDKFPCTYLSAERSISKDMSFSKWSLMWKISKSFNKSITEDQANKLKKHFEWVKTIFNWVSSFSWFERDFKQYFEEMQSDSPYKLNVDFKPFTPNNYFKSINILATDPNVENNIDIEELWDGAKNLTIISLLRSYAKNFRDVNWILAIEEPEIYLHPQARKHLYEILKELADSWIQVIYTTHDPNFLEIWEFESIRRISKIDDSENPGRKYSKINSLTYKELLDFTNSTWWPTGNTLLKIKDFYKSISNYRLTEWFFSNLIILWEWPTEELVIPRYFEAIWYKYNSKWISILWAIWKSQIAKYWRLFHKFWIPVICVFDNDNSDDEKIKNNQFLCNCFHKNIDDFITGLNEDFYKEILITNWKLVILEKDIENVIEKDFLKQWSSIEELNELKNENTYKRQPKPVACLSIANEVITTYWYIPKFIESLKN